MNKQQERDGILLLELYRQRDTGVLTDNERVTLKKELANVFRKYREGEISYNEFAAILGFKKEDHPDADIRKKRDRLSWRNPIDLSY